MRRRAGSAPATIPAGRSRSGRTGRDDAAQDRGGAGALPGAGHGKGPSRAASYRAGKSFLLFLSPFSFFFFLFP